MNFKYMYNNVIVMHVVKIFKHELVYLTIFEFLYNGTFLDDWNPHEQIKLRFFLVVYPIV